MKRELGDLFVFGNTPSKEQERVKNQITQELTINQREVLEIIRPLEIDPGESVRAFEAEMREYFQTRRKHYGLRPYADPAMAYLTQEGFQSRAAELSKFPYFGETHRTGGEYFPEIDLVLIFQPETALPLLWCKRVAHELDHAYTDKSIHTTHFRSLIKGTTQATKPPYHVTSGGILEHDTNHFFEEMGVTNLDYHLTRDELRFKFPEDWHAIQDCNTQQLAETALFYVTDITEGKLLYSSYNGFHRKLLRATEKIPDLFELILEARMLRDMKKLQQAIDSVYGNGAYASLVRMNPETTHPTTA